MKHIDNRRTYGEHLTPVQIFERYILPEIRDILHEYIWVDLFAGAGNLVLPILDYVPQNERIEFFEKHIYLFDIQNELVDLAIENAISYGIPQDIAKQHILQWDTIRDYPTFLLELGLPIFHITNPPYLYLGYIAKHSETQQYLEFFQGENEGYQDLYQLALKNDLKNGLQDMIYIIPSNFIFGFAVSNKIRDDFLKYYTIKKAIIFEKEIFEFTGTNVAICFFEKKDLPKQEVLTFEGIKINTDEHKRVYTLDPKTHYRAGNEFEEFLRQYYTQKPLKIKYYLTVEEVENNPGDFAIDVIDANRFNGKSYEKITIKVNEMLYNKIQSNILFVRTVDTGSMDGRAGLYKIRDVFGVDGILVTKDTHRMHPIQVFSNQAISFEEQILLKDYFNLILEYFRMMTDSEFMTTYQYSKSKYTRKYLGLLQVRKLISTFPIYDLNNEEMIYFNNLVANQNGDKMIEFIKNKNGQGEWKLRY